MTYESLLNSTVYIGTCTSSQNTLGEFTNSWTYSTTSTKCRLQYITAEKSIKISGRFDDIKYICFFLSGTSISTNNRISYGDNYYQVKECVTDSDKHHIKCYLCEI